jgi:hypothetical protein
MVKYREAKKNARRVVSGARGRVYEELYDRLGAKEGEMDIYKKAKIRERETSELNQDKCINDEANHILLKDGEIKNRWRE